MSLHSTTALIPIYETERAHSVLSASGTHRWWNCTASVQYEATFPPGKSSVYAEEGTAAHKLAELCIINGQDCIEYLDRTINGFDVDLGMAENVQVYVDFCRALQALPGAECAVELRVSLESLNPPKPMFGTADFVCLLRKERKVVVVDLKFGQGIVVVAEGNPQPKYYALGVLLAFPNAQIDTIETVIVQPRVIGPPIKRATYDVTEILGWSVDLLEKAAETLGPNAKFAPGKHCRFCRADGQCKAQTKAALDVVGLDLPDATEFSTKFTPADPATLTSREIGALLQKADVLDDFVAGLRATAQRIIESGGEIPGWKLVPRRATRKWKTPDAMPETLTGLGFPADDLWTKKIVSPAQAEEKLAGRIRAAGGLMKDAKETAKKYLAPNIESVSSGTALAPDEDFRPALPSRGSEFDFEESPDRPALPGRGTSDSDFLDLLTGVVNP